MAHKCTKCDRPFNTKQALEQHSRDSPTHTEKALEQHFRPSPTPTTAHICDPCNRFFKKKKDLKQHLRNSPAHAIEASSYDIWPSLHQAVRQRLRAHRLTFNFHHSDDPRDALEEYDTSLMGTFDCTNGQCAARWSSRQVAVTIRQYPGKLYNARVYHQRCENCKWLSQPQLDDSYAERVTYRLAKWSGIALEAPPFSGKSKGPHQFDLCEGCRYGHCAQRRR